MAEQTGTRLGPYRLIAPIGSGGFATVYRAVDERLDAEVAIKVLADNHALDLDIRDRFLAEARLLRRVACEAVIPLFDLGETERGQPYLVLDYADRGDLAERVERRRGQGIEPSAADLRAVADTLVAGLGRAHQVGLVHRDIKPTNLLIAASVGVPRGRPLGTSPLLAHEERLLISDLGLAKDLAASSGMTVGGGTEGFSAPEQRAPGRTVDTRADVFGASAVLYWMATGSPPADDRRAVESSIRSVGLPPTLADAVIHGLAPDPDGRPATIDQWHRAIVEGASTASVAPGDLGSPGRSGASLSRFSGSDRAPSGPWLAGAAAGLVIGFVAAMVVLAGLALVG